MASQKIEPAAPSAFLGNVLARLLELGISRDHADELAPRLEADALRYVRALVPGPLAERVASSRELAQDWFVYSAARFGEGEACAALAARAGREASAIPLPWHPDVTRNEIAAALEGVSGEGADVARWIAERLRGDLFVIFDDNGGEPWFNFSRPRDGWGGSLRRHFDANGEPLFRMPTAAEIAEAEDKETTETAARLTAEMTPDLTHAARLFLSGAWFDVRAVALVVAALRSVRTALEPLEAYRFAARNVRLLCQGEPGTNHARARVVAAAIDRAREKSRADPGPYGDALWRELEAELRAHIAALSEALPPDAEGPTDDASARARFARMNEAFAARAEAIGRGGAGAELAADMRKQPSEGGALWRLWADPGGQVPGCRFAVFLGYVLLLDVVLPRLEARARKPVAIVRHLQQTVSSLVTRRPEPLGAQMALPIPLRHGGEVRLRAEASLVLVDASALAAARGEALRRGLALFSSVAGHRVIRHQIKTGHEQYMSGHHDPRLIEIEGGWSAYAERLGMRGRKAAEEVRAIVEAEHAYEIPLPDGKYGPLLSREFRPAAGRRPAHLTLVLGTALLPNYASTLRQQMGPRAKERDAVVALRLVPLLDDLPPFVGGRSNEHGPQATLSMDVMTFIRDRARELVEEGGVLLDAPTFADMAARAGVPRSMAPKVLERWTSDGPDAPALLKRVAPDRYTLGDAHAMQRAFLEESGRMSIERSEAAREQVKRRRARLGATGVRRSGGALYRAAGT